MSTVIEKTEKVSSAPQPENSERDVNRKKYASILKDISGHEAKIAELRAELPTQWLAFYKFYGKPFTTMLVYANTREEALQRVRARLDRSYSDGYELIEWRVDEYTDPGKAALNADKSWIRALDEKSRTDFLLDFDSMMRGGQPVSSVVVGDVASYRKWLVMTS